MLCEMMFEISRVVLRETIRYSLRTYVLSVANLSLILRDSEHKLFILCVVMSNASSKLEALK